MYSQFMMHGKKNINLFLLFDNTTVMTHLKTILETCGLLHTPNFLCFFLVYVSTRTNCLCNPTRSLTSSCVP